MMLCRFGSVAFGVVAGVLCLLCSHADAVEASPKPFQIKLANGKKVAVRLRGNEHFHWLEDKQQIPVVRTAKGYEYGVQDKTSGKLVASGHRLGEVSPERVGLAPVQARAAKAAPRRASARSPFLEQVIEKHDLTGNINMLVVLMRFKDHRDRALPTPQDVEQIFNCVGGHPTLAPSGSYRDFIHENSYRQFDILSHVVGWVDLPETEAYYAGGDSGLSGSRLDEAYKSAMNTIEADKSLTLDFSLFDRNNDKSIGAVAFLHSGYAAEEVDCEEAYLDQPNRIWSHKSSTPHWTAKTGQVVNNYFVTSALYGCQGAEPCRIGVLLHESAHLGALDDHYDNHDDFNRSAGVGNWCLTGQHRGFDDTQRFPPHLSAWSKAQLGWVKPQEITKSDEYRIRAVEKYPDIYKITHGFPDGEYLLIENRQPIMFDQKIPEGVNGRGGLAIWHIDETKEDNNEAGHPAQTGWPRNGRHFKLALLQADGEYELELPLNEGGDAGDGDDLFRRGFVDRLGPGDTGKFPNTDAYQNGVLRRTGIVISDVSDSAEEMTFRVTFTSP